MKCDRCGGELKDRDGASFRAIDFNVGWDRPLPGRHTVNDCIRRLRDAVEILTEQKADKITLNHDDKL